MVEITERTRSRWLWALAAVTALYGLANVLVFFTTDEFGDTWFATGIFVYSVLLVSAIVLAFLDPGRPAAPMGEAEAEPAAEAAETVPRISHETIYETATGRVLRAVFEEDGTERRRLFAVAGDEMLPASDVEERLRELKPDPDPLEHVEEIEAAVDRRARRPSSASQEVPADADVDFREREVIHESERGEVLRVRYEAGSDEYVHLFAVTEDEVVPLEEIEGSLDELRVDEISVETENVFEEMLARTAERDTEQGQEATVTLR